MGFDGQTAGGQNTAASNMYGRLVDRLRGLKQLKKSKF